MVLARIVKFYFKEGRRDEGFAELDLILDQQVRTAKGFRGFISLLSRGAEDEAVVLTFWEDEDSLIASGRELLTPAIEKVSHAFEKEPDVEHFRVFSTEMYSRRAT